MNDAMAKHATDAPGSIRHSSGADPLVLSGRCTKVMGTKFMGAKFMGMQCAC